MLHKRYKNDATLMYTQVFRSAYSVLVPFSTDFHRIEVIGHGHAPCPSCDSLGCADISTISSSPEHPHAHMHVTTGSVVVTSKLSGCSLCTQQLGCGDYAGINSGDFEHKHDFRNNGVKIWA